MQGAVGVPYRKDGVVGETLRLMGLVVDAAVFSVHILVERGVDHHMVERGVEHGLGVVVAIGLGDGEPLLPCRFRLLLQRVEKAVRV